ncbi:hypothetical protein M406DRAFT_320852 [Cryphonectria parasitica EP155]|uniref:Uncharacterized protein n=1 Tax=Cryphonectria parasitica (strain ATCC 38755 / EP155) TaxID=660469 RepID=A0A9P4Y7J6_CRYP1|nr:uncharacterized protein M406DRAFT_320852 [Cryphonectria parasitica EP155]KAF3768367.1 hypothetical protein M406DRAFT_320852 [Cryphonectria parasitica EP155]
MLISRKRSTSQYSLSSAPLSPYQYVAPRQLYGITIAVTTSPCWFLDAAQLASFASFFICKTNQS